MRTTTITILITSLLCAALPHTPLHAAPSFRADKSYPNLGLKLRTLANSRPEPLAPPQIFTYNMTRGGDTTTIELYDPHELWYATQHLGQWRDRGNNLMVLGQAKFLPPEIPTVVNNHVAREEFDAAIETTIDNLDPENQGDLIKWCELFAGLAIKEPEPMKRPPFNVAAALHLPVEESSIVLYAFRVKQRGAGVQGKPSEWFVVKLEINDGTLTSKVRRDLETQLLANAAGIPTTTPGRPTQGRELAATTQGTTPASTNDEVHPSRVAARKSIENMRDWWFAETADYIFLSNIRSSAGKGLVRRLQTNLHALRAAYATLIPPFESETDVSVIRILESAEEYRQYVGKDMEWSSGAWIPMRGELVVMSQGRDLGKTMEIIQHEGFHQYLFYATSKINNSLWFNEGHACLFESAIVDSRGNVNVSHNSREQHLMQNLNQVAANIPQVLEVGHSGFYSGSQEQRLLNYTTAWSLVYFLRKSVPALKLKAYDQIMDDYLENLAETKDCDAATLAAFEGVDMKQLQQDFIHAWRRGLASSKRYNPFATRQ